MAHAALNEKQRLGAVAAAAAALLATGVALRLIARFTPSPMTEILLGAIAVSLVSPRVGVASEGFGRGARARALRAAAIGMLPALVLVLGALAFLGASLRATSVSSSALLGALEALALAYRDELWLRGIPHACARRIGAHKSLVVAYGGATGVCAVALEPGASALGLALTAAAGTTFALLWQRSGDAWAPVAAHFAWALAVDSWLAGDLLDLRVPHGRLGFGAAGAPAWIALGAFVLLAAALATGKLPLGRAAVVAGKAT